MPDLVAEPEQPQEDEKEVRQMGSMSLLQHLEELRKCIIRSLAAVAVGFGICWYFAQNKIYPVIEKPIDVVFKKYNIDPHLSYLSPTDPFNLYLKVGLMAFGALSRRGFTGMRNASSCRFFFSPWGFF